MRCNRDTEAWPGKGSARLDVYPPTAKKARDPRELFVNLNCSSILDEVPPKESPLWLTKSARLMVPLTNIRRLLDADPSDALTASVCIRKLPGVPCSALQIGSTWLWHPRSLCLQDWGPKL